jgi:ATP-dependent DNA ligase
MSRDGLRFSFCKTAAHRAPDLFTHLLNLEGECRWLEPDLVCQVALVGWTDGGKLRHCTFVGMRDEKAAPKIVRET